MDSLAHRLKKARTLRELSQPALAKLAGVSQGTIGNIEAGIRGGSTSLAQLAHVLQVRYHWLRDGDGEMDLPRSAWPISQDVLAALESADEPKRQQAEDVLRAVLGMDREASPAPLSGKPSHKRAA